jgi:hypothetical protein
MSKVVLDGAFRVTSVAVYHDHGTRVVLLNVLSGEETVLRADFPEGDVEDLLSFIADGTTVQLVLEGI